MNFVDVSRFYYAVVLRLSVGGPTWKESGMAETASVCTIEMASVFDFRGPLFDT